MVLESVSKSGQKPVSEYLTLESGSKTRRRTTDFKKGIFWELISGNDNFPDIQEQLT